MAATVRLRLLLALLWTSVVLSSPSTPNHGPRVDLGYAIYEGTELLVGVNQFLGMRYAASPIGENRFKLPKEPQVEAGHAPVCYGVQGIALPSIPGLQESEDCLFIDVYAPKSAMRRSKGSLPVMLWLQGGGLQSNFNANYNGTGLIEASGRDVVVVTFNYRVGPFGFLASEELQREGNLNLGLHDQRAALKWVQKYIAQFGGDPDNVTLFGTSVGGGSVILQSLAYGGHPPLEDDVKWMSGIGEAVFMPVVYEVSEVQFQYDQILNATSCADLVCLRSLDSAMIQGVNVGRPYPGQSQVPFLPYGPVIDGHLLVDTPQSMIAAGQFARERPLIVGFSYWEGTLFVPEANSTIDINAYLKVQFPNMTTQDFNTMNKLYSNVPESQPGVTAHHAPYFYQLARIFGDILFSCPTLSFAESMTEAGGRLYLWRDNILDPVEVAAGYIVPHTWEIQAVWGPKYSPQYLALPGANSYDAGGINHGIVSIVQEYWTNFAKSGNPNLPKDGSLPRWNTYGHGQRLRIETNATGMETVPQEDLDRCRFWSSISSQTQV
ncbi:Alpha/Beta hydrolase protein [Xylogone sp. PMI_703]|nr:Alpha/Beta hydrolase protein [Xylogone sp. PMI_703]